MKLLEKAMIGVFCALALLSIYYGAYRPFVKAQMYLRAQRAAASAQDVDEVKRIFGEVFDYASPIGEEETVKFFMEYVQGVMYVQGIPEEVVVGLIAYAEEHIDERNIIHLVQMGNMYDALWRGTERSEYFAKAEKYYEKIVAIAPRLPQGLYSLFNMYGAAGMTGKLSEVGKRILAVWPEDIRVRGILETLGSGG